MLSSNVVRRAASKVASRVFAQPAAGFSAIVEPTFGATPTIPPIMESTPQGLFGKLLVANRGEIACRIFKTCKKLGIKTVAVYSEADANAQHVKLADEAICIGPAPALQSYLLPERILQACKMTGANAVHPGYGFLSENAPFAKLLEDNGIAFVGPRSATIAEMGDKIRSKVIAESANVKHIPGFVGAIRDEDHLLEVARGIGYPVMVKAAHGGGGKGMRRANNDEECRTGYRLSLAEAKTAFNSSVMLVEKFIEDPRHIEFQVLGDKQGNAVFVHERECSVQRRNQKLVEEAPSTFLTPEQRAKIGAEAVAIAKISGYENAGTVEFLMGKDGQHYYLEMNTRLQVEHPITEMISGLDLVEQQIRVAAGLPLPFTQEDVKIHGWSVETRVCAEDPINDFLPSVGTMTKFQPPANARVDFGFVEGDKISIHYDSLLAKVITHAPTRAQALAQQERALDETVIHGLKNNICFLREVMQHPKFVAGNLTTNFIADNFPKGFTGHKLAPAEKDALLAGAVSVFLKQTNTAGLAHARAEGTTGNASAIFEDRVATFVVSSPFDGETVQHTYIAMAELSGDASAGAFFAWPIPTVDAVPAAGEAPAQVLRFEGEYDPSRVVFGLRVGDANSQADPADRILQATSVTQSGSAVKLTMMGSDFAFTVLPAAEAKYMPLMPVPVAVDYSKTICAPMPGAVVAVGVAVGQKVVPGQVLAQLSAMKMVSDLVCQKAGVVKEVLVKVGDTVESGAVLIQIE